MRQIPALISSFLVLFFLNSCGSFEDIASKKKDDKNPSAQTDEANDANAEITIEKDSSDVGGPDVGGPDVGGPDVGGPDVGGPDVGGPDVGGPDQEIEPDDIKEITTKAEELSRAVEPCSNRIVSRTNRSRLLVSDKAASGAKMIDRLHPGDFMMVTSRQTGRTIRDDLLKESSDQWLEIIYQSGSETRQGWVNELYASCTETCPYVEFYNLGTSPLFARENPYDKVGKTVHRFYANYTSKVLDKIEDGVEVPFPDGTVSSRSWYQVEVYDGTKETPSQGWVSSVYALCSHGRRNSRDGTLRLPVASRILSSHETDHKNRGSVNAWDINVPYGTPVYPIAAGEIVYAGCNNAGQYGCWTQIRHDNGMTTNMAHMIQGSIKVANRQRVTQDTVLGQVGWTGLTTFGPHVHLEIFVSGARVLLDDYFKQDAMLYCRTCSLKK